MPACAFAANRRAAVLRSAATGARRRAAPALQVSDAIAAYLRAADTSKYNEVIAKANEVGAQRVPALLLLQTYLL